MGTATLTFKLTSPYGAVDSIRDFKPHTGVDLAMPEGTPLKAISEGVIERIVDYGSHNIGKGIIVRLSDGKAAIYGHLSEINVVKGQAVSAGDVIGKSGNSGLSSGPHLHFGLQQADGSFVDPTPLVAQINAMSGNSVFSKLGAWLAERGRVNTYTDDQPSAVGWFIEGVGNGALKTGAYVWQWLVANLPDLMGYGCMLTGACIIIGAMIGKGGMMKPIAIYAVALIITICILGGA